MFKSFFCQLIIFLSITLSLTISHADSDESGVLLSDTAQTMSDVFHEAYYNSKIYQVNQCQSNVIRLYNLFASTVTDLNIEDFHVHIIYSKYGIGTINGPSHKKVLPSRSRNNFLYDNVVKKPYNLWLYHVVLEYQGKIYDLDYGPKAVVFDSVVDYYNHMFDGQLTVGRFGPSAKKYAVDRELLVYRVPGAAYLRQPVLSPVIDEGPIEQVKTMDEIKSGL